MGYYANMSAGTMLVLDEKLESALDALRESAYGREFDGFANLEECFEHLGFESDEVENGIVVIGFDGKWRAQEQVLKLLAPFVEDGGFLDFVGEDGDKWRFEFDNGKLETYQAVITWTQ